MKTLLRFKWAVLLVALGAGVIAWATMYFFAVLFAKPDATFWAPGEATVRIAEPGQYVLWFQSPSQSTDGPSLIAWNESGGVLPAGAAVTVRKIPEGTDVPAVAAGHVTWTANGTVRQSVSRFTVTASGDYRISVIGLPYQGTFCMTRDWFMGTFWWFFAGLAAGVLLILGGLVAGIITLVRVIADRKAARRRSSGRWGGV